MNFIIIRSFAEQNIMQCFQRLLLIITQLFSCILHEHTSKQFSRHINTCYMMDLVFLVFKFKTHFIGRSHWSSTRKTTNTSRKENRRKSVHITKSLTVIIRNHATSNQSILCSTEYCTQRTCFSRRRNSPEIHLCTGFFDCLQRSCRLKVLNTCIGQHLVDKLIGNATLAQIIPIENTF